MIRRIEHDEAVELQLDRPPVNALDASLIAALREHLSTELESDAPALVLSGRPGMFSAGLDVPAFLALDRDAVSDAWRDFFDVMQLCAAAPIPIIAALTGHSPAGGCVIALFCDWRVMAEGKFKIGLNEVQVGLRMPRPIHAAARFVVGARQAERMCTTAELMGVDEARRIGLIDEVAPGDEVVARALARARAFGALPPNALRKTRAIARAPLLRSLENRDEEHLELFIDEWFSEETQTAMQALVDRLKKA